MRRNSESALGGYPSAGGGLGQRRVVEVGLVGVQLGEVGDRVVEAVALAEVRGDRDAIAGAGMGAGQRGGGRASNATPSGTIYSTSNDPFPSRGSAQVEVSLRRPGHASFPAEEDVAGRLHQPLPDDDALPWFLKRSLTYGSAQKAAPP